MSKPAHYTPHTVLAGGIATLGILPTPPLLQTTKLPKIMKKPTQPGRPAKPVKSKTPEDFSTTYVPRSPVVKDSLTPSKPAKKRIKRVVDLSAFTICADPVIRRMVTDGIYESLFAKLAPGQCIKCPSADVGKLGNALRKYTKAKNKGATVRATGDYGDGYGRVFLVAKGAAHEPL